MRRSTLSISTAALLVLVLSGSSCESGFEPIDFGAVAEEESEGTGTFSDFQGSSSIANLQIENGLTGSEFTIQINESDTDLVEGDIVSTGAGFSRFDTDGSQSELNEPFFGLRISDDILITTPIGTNDLTADIFIRTVECPNADIGFNFVNDISDGFNYDSALEGLYGTLDFNATANAFTSTAEDNLFRGESDDAITPRTLGNASCDNGTSRVLSGTDQDATETSRYFYNNRAGLLTLDNNNATAARRLLAVQSSDTEFDLSNLTANNLEVARAIVTDFTRESNETITRGARASCRFENDAALGNITTCDLFVYTDLNDRGTSSATPDYVLRFDTENRSTATNVFSAALDITSPGEENTLAVDETGDLVCNIADNFDEQSLLFINCTGFVDIGVAAEIDRRGFSLYLRADQN